MPQGQRNKRRGWFERQIPSALNAGLVITGCCSKPIAFAFRLAQDKRCTKRHVMRTLSRTVLRCGIVGFLAFLCAARVAVAAHPLSGHKLLVTSIRTGDTEIFIADPVTGDMLNISRSPESEDRYPCWSPDDLPISARFGSCGRMVRMRGSSSPYASKCPSTAAGLRGNPGRTINEPASWLNPRPTSFSLDIA